MEGRYSCISYARGALERTKPIVVDGCQHATTQNLWVILRRLRSMGIIEDIWIDALCIDQNNAEMSSQVRIMREIYTSAKEVFIGMETDDQTQQGQQQYAMASTVLRGLVANRHLDEVMLNGYPTTTLRDHFECFHQLLDSKWFARAWTIQEVCLAEKATVVTAGGCFAWKDVASAFNNWNEHRRGCCSAIMSDHDLELREWFYDTYCRIRSTSATIAALTPGQHIIKPLLYYQSLQATNSVDKYFAFRGLHTQQSTVPLPLPNYDQSKESVFTDLARWLLKDMGSLYILNIGLPDETQRCPSWVPDWSAESSINGIYRRVRLSYLEKYNAARGLIMDLSFPSPAPGLLHLRGICIDKVEDVAADRFDLDSTEENLEVLDAWYKLILLHRRGNVDCDSIYVDEFYLALLGACK